jgi:secretion/DNA translocation related TadE-like protein
VCRDRGSATVWLAGLAALIGLTVTVGTVHGAGVLARHRAETAADLAALAGAVRAADGLTGACPTAAQVALRNGGSLTACEESGGDVQVEVSAPVRLGRLGVLTATARARAGPADRSASGG